MVCHHEAFAHAEEYFYGADALWTKLVKPERRTGLVYKFITQKHDAELARLALCPLAKLVAMVADKAAVDSVHNVR